jgi:uncharacterized SAM-binding protein YcdF (DUF218 family)
VQAKFSRRRTARAAVAALAAVVALAAWLGSDAGGALIVSKAVADPDAIVELASHEWERLPAAARLAATYPRALVLLTLPESVTVFNCHDCARRADRLARAGVAAERIHVLPLTASGTHGEALAVREFARAQPLRAVLVVTSPYHTRRSLATFQHVLRDTVAEVGVVPASEPDPPLHPERWWAVPYDTSYVRYEWAASFYYWFRYGIWSFS